MTDNFRTSISEQELFGLHPKKPTKPDDSMRRFWFLCFPLGFFFGVFAGVVTQSGGAFFGVWLVSSVVLAAFFIKEDEK